MTTKLSSDGQIVLPPSVRQKLGLQPGESLEVTLEHGRVVLERAAVKCKAPEIQTDPISGLPVLSVGGKLAPLTNEQVEHLLTEFP
ncbi:MAG: AbrB/MazE/SpoVT family DNA-binding domain-containing protein [Chthoniobacteraceae bacterium]